MRLPAIFWAVSLATLAAICVHYRYYGLAVGLGFATLFSALDYAVYQNYVISKKRR